MCAITSKKLFNQLQEHGYNCKIAYNNNHCFVILRNRIIDLTATQFNWKIKYPKIFIKRLTKLESGQYRIKRIFDNTKSLSNYQKQEGWREEQI